MNTLESIKDELRKERIDAWLLVDYECHHPIFKRLFGSLMLTRKAFLLIPIAGKPILIVHAIDTVFLKDKNEYELRVYKTWQEMLNLEKSTLSAFKTIAMDISAYGLLPRISLADYGSVEFVKTLSIEVVSSQNILQSLQAGITKRGQELQEEACLKAASIMKSAFKMIKKDILESGFSDEYAIQQYVAKSFDAEDMFYDECCIVAKNANASDPHYTPNETAHSEIQRGDVVLIDMWAKMKDEEAVYADITWMGYAGEEVPDSVAKRFHILRDSIDMALDFLRANLQKRDVFGYQIDDIVRENITKHGFGDYFIHRTGHSIHTDSSPHGPGCNIDDYESRDERKIVPMTSFSLEPGIYMPDFGMRSEIDVFIDENKEVKVPGLRQREVIAILKEE